MRLSQYFLPALKEKPAEAQITSHSLMLRAGMIRQQVAGIYSWLPLGLKVLQNISDIVRKSMNEAGCIEILMPCIQPADLWRESERYDAYGKEMLRITDRHENELLFGPTAEEVVTDIFRGTVKSYRDLPKILYNIQWKFRDEIRPRFGVMRGREFLMKDAYSFDISHEAAVNSYNRIYKAYLKTFKNLGLSAIPVRADTGPIGGDLSHEFHIIAETGESALYYDERFEVLADELSDNMELMKSLYAAADEMHDPNKCPIPESKLRKARGIEVGHIFNFGTKYSAKMGATVSNDKGEMVPLEMGSYGIGISRLAAAIIEANHDERGITWPEEMAPFKASILNLVIENEGCSAISEEIYQIFCAEQIDVLYDDTDARAGQKFATHDLIGSPWQIIVGPKKAEQNLVELKHRRTGEIENLTPEIAAKKVIGNSKA